MPSGSAQTRGKLAQGIGQCEAFYVKLSSIRWARPLSEPQAGAPFAGWARAGVVLLGVVALTLGCAAQNDFREDADWTKDKPQEGGKWREVESLFDATESQGERPDQSLRGVRLDLTVAANQTPDKRCSCLDVVVGRPQDPKFRWAGMRPSISHKNIVVALSTEGSQCLGVGPNRRPSIQAVDTEGRDVIVVVEELPANRPQALGAIVPKPRPGGSIFVRSRKTKRAKLPYAQSNEVHGMCKIVSRTEHSLGIAPGSQ